MSGCHPGARLASLLVFVAFCAPACAPAPQDEAQDPTGGPPSGRAPGTFPRDAGWPDGALDGQTVDEDEAESPLYGRALYVDPASNAAQQAEDWRADRPADASRMDKIAGHAVAAWLGEWSGDVADAVAARVDAADATGTLASFVVYGIPERDCGSHSGGGSADADAYRAWVDAISAGLAGRAAILVLEPDALALTDCLDAAGLATRVELLRYAGASLAQAGGIVYLDAGHAAWVPAADMADLLVEAGVADVAGFAVNVSNFRSDDDSTAYGDAIHARIGARYVVDSSRNGLGPDGDAWCNPPGRALGRPPDTAPPEAAVDAFLWIKAPGESDGSCNGGPSAGTWWPEYALGLAERAAWD